MLDALHVYDDCEPRSAALNMAVDEALLAAAPAPILRFYRWRQPSLSFGYFGLYTEVASQSDEREIVRRWTGGGIVLQYTGTHPEAVKRVVSIEGMGPPPGMIKDSPAYERMNNWIEQMQHGPNAE